MKKRKLGRTDIDVSVLCLGTMMYGEQILEDGAFEQMDASLDRGINFFDTAELYTVPPKSETQGNSERIVGNWIASRGARDKLILATKVTGRTKFLTYIRDGQETRLNTKQIRSALERSLKNLQTDYIDLYQTHWPERDVLTFGRDVQGYKHYKDDWVSFEETLSALTDLQKEGKIRHIGVSNETSWGVMKHLEVAEKNGLARIQSIQNAYNLVNRTFETGLAEIALQEQVGLLAYSPIAQGALSGKYLDGAKPQGSRGALFGRLGRYQTPSADEAIKAYIDIARQFELDPAALALQFVTTRSFVTSNIFGASSMAQLDTAFASLDINWNEDLEKAINEAFSRLRSPCP